MSDSKGWFADSDRDATSEFKWQPCFDTDAGHTPSFQVWFVSKAECEKWIAENVIGAGWAPGEPSA